MFRDSTIQMELVSSLIFGSVVFGVEIKSGEGGDFHAYLAAQVADCGGRFKSPVISADVCQVAFVEGAARGVYAKLALPLKISRLPPHHHREHFYITEPVGRVFLMNARRQTPAAQHHVSLNLQPDVRYNKLHRVLSAQYFPGGLVQE